MRARPPLPSTVESDMLAAIDLAMAFVSAEACPVPRRAGPAQAESPVGMIERLSDRLYAEWYAAVRAPKPLQLGDGAPPLLGMLRAAHAGSLRWESGWRAVQVSSAGRVVASKGTEQRLLGLADYVCDERPGLPPRPGAMISVTGRRESSRVVPGFWVTHTEAWQPQSGPFVRLYWNVQPAGAAALVREITQRLDSQLPYALKVPADPALFARTDAGVLYLADRASPAVLPQVGGIHRAIGDVLGDEVPKLCKRLAPGLGLAEDSGGALESFGTSRCRLIAEAIIATPTRGTATRAQLLRAICRRFADAGIPPEKPHLRGRGDRGYAI